MQKLLVTAWVMLACAMIFTGSLRTVDSARADTPAAAPADTSAATPTSLAHPAPPSLAPAPPGVDLDTTTPTLAPPPDAAKVSNELGSVTCFACPEGQDYYHGSICMDGVACAAEGVTLQQLNIGVGRGNAALTEALHKLAAARVALTKTDKESRAKALQYINSAASDLKTAGLKAACKTR